MGGMESTDTAADVAAICRLKYRYLRTLDTKRWDEFEATLTEDVTGAYGASLTFDTRERLVDFMRTSLGTAEIITEHHVGHPEIDIDPGGDTATGHWYLQDRVIAAGAQFMLFGAAVYTDTYRRTDDGWRISSTGYQRTYEATVSLADVPSFGLTTGPAIYLPEAAAETTAPTASAVADQVQPDTR